MLELWPVTVTQIFLATSVGILLHPNRERKLKILQTRLFSFWKIILNFCFIPFADCNLNDTFGILLLSLKKVKKNNQVFY